MQSYEFFTLRNEVRKQQTKIHIWLPIKDKLRKEGNITAKAIVLITANPGKDREIAGKVKEIEGVENVYLAAGRYDVVAEAYAPDDDDSILALTYDKIRIIDGIRETHTMFCMKL